MFTFELEKLCKITSSTNRDYISTWSTKRFAQDVSTALLILLISSS